MNNPCVDPHLDKVFFHRIVYNRLEEYMDSEFRQVHDNWYLDKPAGMLVHACVNRDRNTMGLAGAGSDQMFVCGRCLKKQEIPKAKYMAVALKLKVKT